MSDIVHLGLNYPELQTEEQLTARLQDELVKKIGHTGIYLTSIQYEGLEYSETAEVTLVGNNRLWR